MEQIKDLVQGFVNGFGTGCSKEEMIVKVYRFLCGKDIDCCILNDKYLEFDGFIVELIRKRSAGVWVAKIIEK